MKNIFKIAIFTLFTVLLVSCTNDKEPITSLNGFEFRDISEFPSPSVLLKANDSQVYKKLEWDRADYGVPVVATYSIVVTDHEKDPNFLKPIESIESVTGLDPNPDARKVTLTVKMFNDMISQLKTFNCGVMNIDVRIKSIIGTSTNKQIQYSEPKTIAVTGYPTKPNLLSFSNVSSTTLTTNVSSSTSDNLNDYEGYEYLEAGDYKFYKPDACGSFTSPIVYGADAGGVLVEGGGTNININIAGHYYITANLTPGGLKYTVQNYRAFGIFGDGVKGILNEPTAVPMSDDTNGNLWKITFDLFRGKSFRFKSDNWIGDLSGDPPSVPAGLRPITTLGSFSDGILVKVAASNGQIKVPGTDDGSRQKYKITIDVSKPRNYTYKLELVE